jgi:rhodanese-related sulfurtransferase
MAGLQAAQRRGCTTLRQQQARPSFACLLCQLRQLLQPVHAAARAVRAAAARPGRGVQPQQQGVVVCRGGQRPAAAAAAARRAGQFAGRHGAAAGALPPARADIEQRA